MSYPKSFACHFIGVGGVVFHNEKVLLVKLTYGPAEGKWLIPGGLVDCGETLQEAVEREIYEEAGVQVHPVGIIGLRSMIRARDQLTDLYCIFLCELVSSPDLQNSDEEIADVRWIPLDELETEPLMTEYTKYAVQKAQNSKLMEYDLFWSREAQKRPTLEKYEHFWI
jgi:ADP-ribose pyrophosphatase YjhB (NUDIX family)